MTRIWDIDVKQFRTGEKILRHPGRLREWLDGRNPFPIMVEFDMTNVCNHRCPECIANHYRKVDRVSLSGDLARRVISEMAEGGLKGISFTGGGEPFCNPDTCETIRWAKKCGLDVVVVTNGSLLDDAVCETIVENCIGIAVSLDAATPETFRKMHGRGAKHFFHVVANIRRLAEAKQRVASNCSVGLAVLTCDTTKPDMVAAAKLAKEVGVDYVHFRPLMIHRGGQFKYHWPDMEKELEACLDLREPGSFDVLFSKDKYLSIREVNFGRSYGRCFGHQFAGAVSANGKVYLCCHLRGYPQYDLGDLHNQSFRDIWNGERRRQVIASIDFHDCIPLCRCNAFNKVLWEIWNDPSSLDARILEMPIPHENIL